VSICLQYEAAGDQFIGGGAGQAVVQMAKGKHDRQEYAIKFFLNRDYFNVEEGMYTRGAQGSPLSQFLPRVCSIPSFSPLLSIFAALSENMPRVIAICDVSRASPMCTLEMLRYDVHRDQMYAMYGQNQAAYGA
jgi:hypothetical protein